MLAQKPNKDTNSVMLSKFWSFLQLSLYPALEECLQSRLSDREQRVIALLEFLRVEDYVKRLPYCGVGRVPYNRICLARAFIAKTAYGFKTTKDLVEALDAQPGLRLICGIQDGQPVPSESTFSRAFHEFAQAGLGDLCHEGVVRRYVGETPVLHLSRDSTSLRGREQMAPRGPKVKRRWDDQPTRTQYGQSATDALASLSRVCGVGRKPNSQGNLETCIGFKVHIDWLDGMVPANVQTTSMSVHDCLLAIPMMRTTAERVPNIAYQLMDSAYDAPAIRQACRDLGQVGLIEGQRRRKDYVPFDPAQAVRFGERTNAERGFSRLKDSFGLCDLRVRGPKKVHLHVMFCVLALFADQMLKPVCR